MATAAEDIVAFVAIQRSSDHEGEKEEAYKQVEEQEQVPEEEGMKLDCRSRSSGGSSCGSRGGEMHGGKDSADGGGSIYGDFEWVIGDLAFHCEHEVSEDDAADVLVSIGRFWEPWKDRTSVSEVLESYSDGAFRIRPSRHRPSSKVLCVKYGQIVLHYLLER